jgi:hypothetical protein
MWFACPTSRVAAVSRIAGVSLGGLNLGAGDQAADRVQESYILSREASQCSSQRFLAKKSADPDSWQQLTLQTEGQTHVLAPSPAAHLLMPPRPRHERPSTLRRRYQLQ